MMESGLESVLESLASGLHVTCYFSKRSLADAWLAHSNRFFGAKVDMHGGSGSQATYRLIQLTNECCKKIFRSGQTGCGYGMA